MNPAAVLESIQLDWTLRRTGHDLTHAELTTLSLSSYEMASDDKLSDDYVASLLAKDAKDRSIKYSSYGLGALLPKRYAVSCLTD